MNSDVAIVGGGLAGLAAACALAESGYRVQLIERRPYVGGRASSYEHPGTGEIVDNCQHILLGCCTNLIGFYRQLGVEDRIQWFDRITFIEPGGRETVLRPGHLPSPFHSSGSFLLASSLSLADKAGIARAMMSFLRGIPDDAGEDFAQWLAQHGQTHRAIARFWRPVLISALNDELDRVSAKYAGMVFRKAFMQSARAGAMGIPRIPLSELYGHAVEFLSAHSGVVRLRTAVRGLSYDAGNGLWRLSVDGASIAAKAVILALPFESMQALLPSMPPSTNGGGETLNEQLRHFEHSPITGVHLWFDRPVTKLTHAALLDTTIQWMYNKSLLQPETRATVSPAGTGIGGKSAGQYLELVVSSSRSLVEKSRQEIIDLALRELREFFPDVGKAVLVKAAVVKEVRATFSVRPGLDPYRPGPVTGWPQLFLAGDWTRTGWPSTMEGAVRSGYLAAEAFTKAAGQPRTFLLPELPPRGCMRWFGHG